MPIFNFRAIIVALFLPLLVWIGSVIAISFMGYPGVICMTPVAWVLALPVGLRVQQESARDGKRPVWDAALAGGILGLWQGLLVPVVIIIWPSALGISLLGAPSPLFSGLLATLCSVPVTAGLAALFAVLASRRK